MFIGIKDMHGNYIINADNIESIEYDKNVICDTCGINIAMTSGEILEPEWSYEADRDRMMSYLYARLVASGQGSAHPNRFIGVEDL